MTEAANDFDFFNELAQNDDFIDNGAPVKFRNGTVFKLSKISNREFRRKAAALYQEHEAALKSGNEEQIEAATKEITMTLLTTVVVKGWEGKIKFKGEMLEYSQENARKLLELTEFREWVDAEASNKANFKLVTVTEEDVKN